MKIGPERLRDQQAAELTKAGRKRNNCEQMLSSECKGMRKTRGGRESLRSADLSH
jgi:hypothetical protein